MQQALFVGVLTLLITSPVLARDPFGLNAEVNGEIAARSYTTLEQAYNSLSTESLKKVFPTYTETSPVNAVLNLRGVQALGNFTNGSPVLRFQVPGIGIDQTFSGATREESVRLLQGWFQGQGQSQVNALVRYAVRTTPIDPIAGNPNSALTGLAISDFSRAVEDASLGEGAAFGIGARFGSFSAGGYNSSNISLPLNYSWRITERDTLQLDVPVSYADYAGGASYSGNIGLLYRRRVLDNWTLQASARVGGAGSVDLGAGAGIYGLGLTSTYVVRLPTQLRLTIANSINYLSTFPVSIGRYSLDYGVSNTVFRNGLVLTRSLGMELWGRPLTGSVFAVDTRFAGTAVYVRNFQEFGAYVSAGRQARGGLGVTLMTGDRGLFGFTVNTGVRF